MNKMVINCNARTQDNSTETENQHPENNRPVVHLKNGQIRLRESSQNEKAQTYANLFNELLEKYAGQDEITLYTTYGAPRKTDIEELMSCKQIYTDDHEQTFWKERNYIPRSEKLFLAPTGLLVEIKAHINEFGLYYMKPDKHGRKNNRCRYRLKDALSQKGGIVSPEKLLILTFNGQYSPNVRKLLDEEGPQIIFSDKIQVHHIYGYKTNSDPEKKEMCDLFVK